MPSKDSETNITSTTEWKNKQASPETSTHKARTFDDLMWALGRIMNPATKLELLLKRPESIGERRIPCVDPSCLKHMAGLSAQKAA